jgi:hypothetical protein
MKKQSGRGGPALNAEASATAEKKKLFHRFKKVRERERESERESVCIATDTRAKEGSNVWLGA